MAKLLIDEKIGKWSKREDEQQLLKNIKNLTTNNESDQSYDYSQLKSEYFKEIKTAEKSNNTLNFSDNPDKEDESFKERAVDVVVDLKKTPKNCTAEESDGIGLAKSSFAIHVLIIILINIAGFGAVKCLWNDAKKSTHNKTTIFVLIKKILRLIVIWFGIYLVVAILCWCQKGIEILVRKNNVFNMWRMSKMTNT